MLASRFYSSHHTIYLYAQYSEHSISMYTMCHLNVKNNSDHVTTSLIIRINSSWCRRTCHSHISWIVQCFVRNLHQGLMVLDMVRMRHRSIHGDVIPSCLGGKILSRR